VWLDALINYISALGYTDDGERFPRYWPADIHMVGKDIIKFHAVIWPAILMSLGLPLPHKVFAHGWWMMKGVKMSKSRNNVIDPGWLASRFGSDYLRYFLLREVPFGDDGNFSPALFIKRVNSDLANDFGNLLNRTLALVEKYAEGRVPSPGPMQSDDDELRSRIESLGPRMRELMDTLSFAHALESAWEVVRFGNLYLDHCAPWRIAKQGQMQRAHTVLYNVLETIRWLCVVLFPFIPEGTQKMWDQLGYLTPLANERLERASHWGLLRAGTMVKKGLPVFPRITEDDFYETEGEG